MDMVRPQTEPAGQANPSGKGRVRGKLRGDPRRSDRAHAGQKSLAGEIFGCPYRKPTLVGGGKSPEVIEITLVKEFGNLTP